MGLVRMLSCTRLIVELINYNMVEIGTNDIGVQHITLTHNLYTVIDEPLFFLSVIKYGIEFKVIFRG